MVNMQEGGVRMVDASAERQFRATLRDHGLRVTPNRLRMFRTLASHAEPLTSQQLAGLLADEGMNATTVYRMMQQLTEAGIVHPVMVGHEHIGYELVSPYRPHHDHFLCVSCHRTFDLAECGLDDALVKLAERNGFQVTFHHAELHGLCPECRVRGAQSGS
jgi:Fur family ferric uptake transcriptional regulator